jgi:photosystem II stability/assembly factor-like uncharacterized protein
MKHLAVAAIATVIFAGSAACSSSHHSSAPPPTSSPTSPTSPTTAPATTATNPPVSVVAGQDGAAVAAGGLRDMVFVDHIHGYGFVGGIGSLVASTDGGVTWRFHGSPVPVLGNEESNGVAHVLFVSPALGYVYGNGLSLTTDGGMTWTSPTVGSGTITSLVAIGASVWAIAGNRLYASDDSGASWHPLTAAPTYPTPPQLARITTTRAVIVSDSGLATTTDGGATWVPLPSPCAFPGAEGSRAVAFGSDLLLLCPGSPGAGQQPLDVYASTDGGAHWALRAASGTAQQAKVGTVPGRCCLAVLAGVSPTTAWMAIGEDTLYGTTDGGVTWTPVITTTGGGDGASRVTFVDATHGWTLDRQAVWRTTDGVHWTNLG